MCQGSSPRMRGSQAYLHLLGPIFGIIPAHAGLTRRTHGPKLTGRDHPRACGAHSSSNASTLGYQGSSPRMRGSLLLRFDGLLLCGIIPAHAGLTGVSSPSWSNLRDHPRACGAHTADAWAKANRQGSSPRMRGSLFFKRFHARVPGIIPAHAGLTASALRRSPAVRDHPRACGAHSRSPSTYRVPSGSSPRMRGSLQRL